MFIIIIITIVIVVVIFIIIMVIVVVVITIIIIMVQSRFLIVESEMGSPFSGLLLLFWLSGRYCNADL